MSRIMVQVISESTREFALKKGGMGKDVSLSCLDQDSEMPLKNTFDYKLNEEERSKYGGRLRGKVILLGIEEEREWNGRQEKKGRIIHVPDGFEEKQDKQPATAAKTVSK